MAQDPVKVDSKHYTVEFENAQVRVLRIKVGPHEKVCHAPAPECSGDILNGRKWQVQFSESTGAGRYV